MRGGAKFLAATALIATAACTGDNGKVEVRALPAPPSAGIKPVPVRIAEARGHLALGNVALALESYRKALRDQPDSVEALVGIATCYDKMGRFDISRRNYEAALAIAPSDESLLAAFAGSLELQGRRDEAASVRVEISTKLAAGAPHEASGAPTPLVESQLASIEPVKAASPPMIMQPVSTPASGPEKVARPPRAIPPISKPAAAPALGPTVTIKLPPARSVAAAPPVIERQAVPTPQPMRIASTQPLSQPVAQAAPRPAPVAPARSEGKPEAPARPEVKSVVPAAVVTFPLPPARSVFVSRPGQPVQSAVWLERLSLGEVALRTDGRPQWRAQLVSAEKRSTTIRFVPLRTTQVRFASIRLLNAARHQGLAAQTRGYLAQRGWRQMAIGDASAVRQRSLILYPANRRATANRLATQFGYLMAMRETGTDVIVLLGRDSVRRARSRKIA